MRPAALSWDRGHDSFRHLNVLSHNDRVAGVGNLSEDLDHLVLTHDSPGALSLDAIHSCRRKLFSSLNQSVDSAMANKRVISQIAFNRVEFEALISHSAISVVDGDAFGTVANFVRALCHHSYHLKFDGSVLRKGVYSDDNKG